MTSLTKVFGIFVLGAVVSAAVSFSLVSFKLAFGLAGSLENLQNQVNGENSYRQELENYVISNNVSLGESGSLTLSDFTDAELEELVKSDMSGDMSPAIIIAEKADEKIASSIETFKCVLNPNEIGC